MLGFIPLLLLPALLAVAASPRVLHEKRTGSVKVSKHRRLDARTSVPMKIGLTQSNTHRVEELLLDVSHPDSPNYGKHYNPQEVADIFKPSDDTINAVFAWLEEHGIGEDRASLSPTKGWIHFPATVAEIETLLDTTFHVYKHQDGSEHVGCEEYSLPVHSFALPRYSRRGEWVP